jgi:hypothetical protein
MLYWRVRHRTGPFFFITPPFLLLYFFLFISHILPIGPLFSNTPHNRFVSHSQIKGHFSESGTVTSQSSHLILLCVRISDVSVMATLIYGQSLLHY